MAVDVLVAEAATADAINKENAVREGGAGNPVFSLPDK
jgi:hypothetical protein